MKENEYMGRALQQAQAAFEMGEIPVGAVAVQGEEVIAWAHNEKELRQDATAHAELLVIQRAAQRLSRWRLDDITIYSTLEPCPMCAGAMVNARIKRLVYGSRDEKAGAAGSVIDLIRYPGLNHVVEVIPDVLRDDCTLLLQRFFSQLRDRGNE